MVSRGVEVEDGLLNILGGRLSLAEHEGLAYDAAEAMELNGCDLCRERRRLLLSRQAREARDVRYDVLGPEQPVLWVLVELSRPRDTQAEPVRYRPWGVEDIGAQQRARLAA